MGKTNFQILGQQWVHPLELWPDELEFILESLSDKELEDFTREFLDHPINTEAQETSGTPSL